MDKGISREFEVIEPVIGKAHSDWPVPNMEEMAVLKVIEAVKPLGDRLLSALDKGELGSVDQLIDGGNGQMGVNQDKILAAAVEKGVIGAMGRTLLEVAWKAQDLMAMEQARKHAADLTTQGEGWKIPDRKPGPG